MATWDAVAASKPPSLVLSPASVAYWMGMAILADGTGGYGLRDRCLAVAAGIVAEKRKVSNEPQADA